MTIGELVYKQAVEQGYNPTFAEGLVSPLNKAMESYQRVFETLKEPLKQVGSVVESIRPQMEMISKISFPTIPSILPLASIINDNDEEDDFPYSAFIRPIQDVRITNIEDLSGTQAKTETKFITASYILPPNANWESLRVKFKDGHLVRVSYPNMKSETFDFRQMGFSDGKSDRPDRKWLLLESIANYDGALLKANFDRRFYRNVKYELNQKLKRFFGMKSNPISNYTKRHGYEALFTLLPDR